MNRVIQKIVSPLVLSVFSVLSFAATPTSYSNMFISYYSPQDVQSMAAYAQQNNLGGYILWEMKGDAPYSQPTSLLKALNDSYAGKTAPMIMAYWTNWSPYGASHAIPEDNYGIPDSLDSKGNPVINPDFTAKLAGVNTLAYAFLEAVANGSSTGTVYFSDPWSDLFDMGQRPSQDEFCNANPNICWYVYTSQHKNPAGYMGNFIAFARNLHPNTALSKYISIGGAGHDSTFEASFASQAYIDNFASSVAAIVNSFGLDGVDLDYENPNMTFAQSSSFYQLVDTLHNKLPGTKIAVTLLANPAYLNGQGNTGFAPRVLMNLSKIVDHINLMTYDFHGAFDYNPNGSGRTGFLTNLLMPSNAPSGYNPQFSVESSVKMLETQGVPAAKISIGIPAYGRALANINSANNGLFQVITNQSIVPAGDLDSAGCSMNLPNNTCSGTFTYSYILKNMLGQGFVPTDWQQSGINNGTTAYANSWAIPNSDAGYTLELSNTGASSNGDLGLQITIKNASGATFGPSDYLGPSLDKVYNMLSNPNTTKINGQSNLQVSWTTYPGGPSGSSCPLFNLTHNTHVMVRVSKDNKTDCTILELPSK